MIVKFFKKKLHSNSTNVDDYPVFYKYTVFQGVTIVPVTSIMERILSPWNRKYKTNFEVIKFLDNVLPSLGFPSGGCYIFYFFYKYLYFRLTGEIYSTSSLVKRHYRLYKKMISSEMLHYDLKRDYNPFKRKVFVKRFSMN